MADLYFAGLFMKLSWSNTRHVRNMLLLRRRAKADDNYFRPARVSTLFGYFSKGSLGIAPTRNCTPFLKIGFMVARCGFYSYYIHHESKSAKERNIARKKLSFRHTKRCKTFLKDGCNSVWVQFHVYKF